MKLVVGISGRIGSGKSVVSGYLQKRYGGSCHMFSQILMDILERLHLPQERLSLQKLGVALRSELGEDVLVKALKADLEEDTSEILIIDGIRYPNEVYMLRNFEKNILISVTAPGEVRYERVRLRGERGEQNVSFEEFKEADRRMTERFLDEIAEKADYVVENTGSLEDLYERVDEIMVRRLQ